MKKASPYIAAGLFAAAVIARLLFPGAGGRSETAALPFAEKSVPQQTVEEKTAREPVVMTINAADYLTENMGMTLQRELPEAVEQAVETFLDEQARYEDLAVPADVTYDMPELSFPYIRPVRAAVSSGFGYRIHPLENLTKFHYGTDLAALSGDDILCFAAGTVSEVGEDETNGRFIRVDHPGGVTSMYAHCGVVYVKPGQDVAMGQKLGLVGVSGKVTGPHLHFELTKNGIHLNPEFYFAAV